MAPYQPVVVDFPRFQRLVEEHGETGEGVGSGERGGGEVGERVEGDELSSIAHTGSQQGGGNVTVDSNMDLPKGRCACVTRIKCRTTVLMCCLPCDLVAV